LDINLASLAETEQTEKYKKEMKNLTKLIFSLWPLLGFHAYGQNLVLNPGFETGTFADWTLVGVPDTFTSSVRASAAHSGDFGASLTSFDGSAAIYQNIAIKTGDAYDLSFWVQTAPPPSGETYDLTASFGSTQLLNLSDPAYSVSDYKEYSYPDIPAGNGILTFGFNDQDIPFFLDDISVTQVVVPDSGPGLALVAATLLGVCVFAYKLRPRFVA
jgi:hypothetical protein